MTLVHVYLCFCNFFPILFSVFPPFLFGIPLDMLCNKGKGHLSVSRVISRKGRNSFGGRNISNSLSVRRRTDLEPVNVECIWIEIRDPTCNFLLWCTYWPPNSDKSIWRNICWSIDKASDISNKFDKVGDLNEHSTHSPIQQKNKIIEPTSVTQSTTTLIDPIQVSVFDSGTFEGDQKVYACILSFSKQCDTSLQRAV